MYKMFSWTLINLGQNFQSVHSFSLVCFVKMKGKKIKKTMEGERMLAAKKKERKKKYSKKVRNKERNKETTKQRNKYSKKQRLKESNKETKKEIQ